MAISETSTKVQIGSSEKSIAPLAAHSVPHCVYAGRRVGLVIPQEHHYPFFFDVRSEIELAPFWQGRRRFPSATEYLHFVNEVMFNIFVVVKLDEGLRPIGFVYDYDMNAEDGFTFVASSMRREEMAKGYGAEATWLFFRWLFDTYPVRKLYSDVFGYDKLSLSTALNGGFREEGCFRDHRYWQGQYWDVHRLALYRNDWLQLRSRARSRIWAS